MSPPPAKVILQTSQVPTTLLSQGAKKTAPAIGPQCAAGGRTQDPPKAHPRLGEVPEVLNVLERMRMEVVRMEAVRMALMDQLPADGPADGPSATWTSKQAQLAAG